MILVKLRVICDEDKEEIADIVNADRAIYPLHDLMVDGALHLDHALIVEATVKEVEYGEATS